MGEIIMEFINQFVAVWAVSFITSFGIDILVSLSLLKDVISNGYKMNNDYIQGQKMNSKVKNVKIIRMIPIINVFNSIVQASKYFMNRDMQLDAFLVLGALKELNATEINAYKKDPSLLNVVRINNDMIKPENYIPYTNNEEIGKIYFECDDDGHIIIVASEGSANNLTIFEQASYVRDTISKTKEEFLDETIDSYCKEFKSEETNNIEERIKVKKRVKKK